MNYSQLPDKITYDSAARLTSIEIDNNDILKIIRSLHVNKAHGHDGILIRMIRMYVMNLRMYVMNHWFSHCDLFSGVVLILVFIHIHGRNLT